MMTRILRMSIAATLVLQAGATALASDDQALARAEQIVRGRCFLCHGLHGESTSEAFPRLAEQNADYVAKQLANFRSGERKSESMKAMVADLSAEDMRALGLYFSKQRSEPHAPSDAALAARGKAVYEKGGEAKEVLACAGCHGVRGHGSDTLPRLAGQVAIYLETQIRQFGKRERTNDNQVMHIIAANMSEEEIKSVAEYMSGLD